MLTGDAFELPGEDLILITCTAPADSPAQEQLDSRASWTASHSRMAVASNMLLSLPSVVGGTRSGVQSGGQLLCGAGQCTGTMSRLIAGPGGQRAEWPGDGKACATFGPGEHA